MSRRHAYIWSHPGHYLVDPYTCVVKGQGHIDLENSKIKVMAKVKPDSHLWGI